MIPTCQILIGDVRTKLRELADESVQCVVTSPPYWALRDYGVDGQIGLEDSPEEFLAVMVDVFREVRRVLKKNGTAWVNMGDSYAGSGNGPMGKNSQLLGNGHQGGGPKRLEVRRPSRGSRIGSEHGESGHTSGQPALLGFKPKDMIGMPWRLAFALQADGWWLRQDIIWHKPNPMPESTRDRCTKAHEYIFLLSKSAKYFYDAASIKEPVTGGAHRRGNGVNPKSTGVGWGYAEDEKPRTLKPVHGWQYDGSDRSAITKNKGPRAKQNASFSAAVVNLVDNRNKRSVWTVPTEAYSEAHYATFPRDLIRPCILAGSRIGDTVLDPFGGSGTTALVAMEYGRHAVLIDLNPANEALMLGRIAPIAGQGVIAL